MPSSPKKHRQSYFRRDLQVALGWTAPHFEADFWELKKFCRSLLEKYYVLERTGAQQDPEAKRKMKTAIVEKYPEIFEGPKNAKKLDEVMRFVKEEQSARRGTWARKKREQQRREVLVKESDIEEYMTIYDSDDSSLEVLDNEDQSSIPTPSQKRIVDFWACPSASSVTDQRPTGMTDVPHKSPDTRNHDESSSRKREKSQAPEAQRQHLLEFLQECRPTMVQWYGPLVAFGCDNLSFVEALTRWDDENLKAGLRLIKDQPGIDEKLEEIDIVFLFRNLRKRLQTRAALD